MENSLVLRTPNNLSAKLTSQVTAYVKLYTAETTSEKKRAEILANINRKELFKPDFDSFSAFCEKVLQLKKSNVSRIISVEKRFNTEKYAFIWKSAFPISWLYEIKDCTDEDLMRFGIVDGFTPSDFSRDKLRKLVKGEKDTITIPDDKTKVTETKAETETKADEKINTISEAEAESIREEIEKTQVEIFNEYSEFIEYLSQLVADKRVFTVTYGDCTYFVRFSK